MTEVLVAPLETPLKVDWQNDTDADHHDNESEGDQVALKLQILNGVAAALLKILLITEKKWSGSLKGFKYHRFPQINVSHVCIILN